ncbi:MAG: N-acetylglucosamine-6-phosphate deacetylase [Streptosporangiaceae bacterium]
MIVSAERVIAHDARHPAGTRVLAPGAVRIDDGVVGEVREGRVSSPDLRLPDGVLAPGLVDLQVNGYFGVDLVDADADGWAQVAGGLPGTGVTAFLPTFITAPVERLVDALRSAAPLTAAPEVKGGARPLGVHLEGPFLSARRRGAHNEAWLVDPDPRTLDALLSAAPGLVRAVTLAPERTGGLDAVRRLVEAGVVVSVGHSDATSAQVGAAADAGATLVTHLYNGQRGFHHREPGVVGRALTDQRLASGLVADLHHVAPEACLVAFGAAAGRIFLVTDAVAAAGMPPGLYVLGGEPVEVGGDGPPLRASGVLAGSGLRLDDAVANVVSIGVDLVTAVDAASWVPADAIGRPDLGRIAPGAAADLVWLGDDLRAKATWVAGELVHGTDAIG